MTAVPSTGPGNKQTAAVCGAELIAAERVRQVEQEGWTPRHDAEHAGEGLALAACCYAVPPQMRKYKTALADGYGDERGDRYRAVPTLWPWHPDYWKPCADDRVRELVKAGALIAAEIDRLQAAR
jgi:hypothetical protein